MKKTTSTNKVQPKTTAPGPLPAKKVLNPIVIGGVNTLKASSLASHATASKSLNSKLPDKAPLQHQTQQKPVEQVQQQVFEEEKTNSNYLFERIQESEQTCIGIQNENIKILGSFSYSFRQKHLSQFNANESDSRIIHHWKSLLSSAQSEDNSFFNFSKFSNEFDTVFFNAGVNKQFTDFTFPADQQVLNGTNGHYTFRRASEIYQEFDIFDKDIIISPDKIQQGQLGDCYLISSISALAEYPELCARLFVQQQKNSRGVYGVWLYESGEWKQVVIDDFLVCSSSEKPFPVFAKPSGKGIWVQLLEKAYAKVYGGYGKIEVGYSFDSLRDISGSPTEYIDIKKNFLQAFETVRISLASKFILTASSKVSSADLLSKHSYTITDAREVKNEKGQLVKMIKLKNPLGFNFQMEYGKDSMALQNNLGEEIRQSNGIIWMTEKQILDNFEVFTVCHTHLGFVNGSYSVSNKTTEVLYVQNLVPDNHCYFSIVQKHEKFFRQGPNDPKQYYKTARIIVAKIDSVEKRIVEVIGGNFGNKQQVFFEAKSLPIGEYLVFIEVDSKKQPQTNSFTFSTFSKNVVSISKAEDQIRFKASFGTLVKAMFTDYIAQVNSMADWNTKVYDNTKGSGHVVRDYSSLFGFAFISYRNQSETVFSETVEVVESDNLELTNFERTEKQVTKEVKVQPGQSHLLIFRILENNACSHSLKFKGTWFFGTGIIKAPIASAANKGMAQLIKAPIVSTANKGIAQKKTVITSGSETIHGKSLSLKGMVDAYADL